MIVTIYGPNDNPVNKDQAKDFITSFLKVKKNVTFLLPDNGYVMNVFSDILNDLGVDYKIIVANWSTNKRSAGIIRDAKLAEFSDCLILFDDDSHIVNNIYNLFVDRNLQINCVSLFQEHETYNIIVD